jgi:hypothetical protein
MRPADAAADSSASHADNVGTYPSSSNPSWSYTLANASSHEPNTGRNLERAIVSLV